MSQFHLKSTSSICPPDETISTQSADSNSEIESSFDWQFYLQYYEDLVLLSTCKEAIEHWLAHGQPEGRIGSEEALKQYLALNQSKLPEDFNEEDYLSLNLDLQQSLAGHPYRKYRAIEHFLCYGKAEQRDYKKDCQFDNVNTFTQTSDAVRSRDSQQPSSALTRYLQWQTNIEAQTALPATLPETVLSPEIARSNSPTKSRILLIDTCKETHNQYILLTILNALQRHEDVEFVTLCSHQDALSTFVRAKCDTLIAVGGNSSNSPILARLAALAKCSVLWTPE